MYDPCARLRCRSVRRPVCTPSDILKQQGHFHDLNTVAYSADGSLIATGGDDGKVKIFPSFPPASALML